MHRGASSAAVGGFAAVLWAALAASVVGAACSDDADAGADVADASADEVDVGGADVAAVDAVDDTPGDAASDATPTSLFAGRGSYAVAASRVSLVLDGAPFDVALFTPAETGGGVVPLWDLADAEHAAALHEAVDAAPEACTTRNVDLGDTGLPTDGQRFPVILFSHCYACMELSSVSTLVQLASHGFVVAAVEHTGTTWSDEGAGTLAALDIAAVDRRVAQLRLAIDAVTARDDVDASRVGLLGHSLGAVTVGATANVDDRVDAVIAMGAPIESPLFVGPTISAIHVPLLFVLLTEDNSITELGNNLIRGNFASAASPAWLAEIEDAGHWSVSDICGLAERFDAGCGEDTRQTAPGVTFSYIPVADGLALSAATATRFFLATLRDSAEADAELDETWDPRLTVTRR